MFKNLRFSFLIILFSVTCIESIAQNVISSDDLLIAGKTAITEEKNYPKAITLLRQAYTLSPDYTDVKILLGRAYQLNKNLDSSRYFFKEARIKDPANIDLLNYLIGLEYGAGNLSTAIELVDSALFYHPRNEELLLKKASMLYEGKHYKEAQLVLNYLLAANSGNEKALSLNNQVSMLVASNKVSLYYDYSQFDKLYQPWHTTSVAYQRSTSVGSFIGRVNYANRSNGLSGFQYELESYPLFSKSFYGNFAIAVNSGESVFPKFTAKGSLFKALRTYEVEGGFRYVNTPEQNFMIYSAGVSKYISRFLLNLKTYIIDFSGASGQGLQLSSRYYYKENSDDVFILGLGTGVAPDLTNRNLGIANISNLSGRRIFSEYRRVLAGDHILSLLGSFGYDEYTVTKSANQFSIGFGYQRKF
jgi:YaiO family outer membrane protein